MALVKLLHFIVRTFWLFIFNLCQVPLAWASELFQVKLYLCGCYLEIINYFFCCLKTFYSWRDTNNHCSVCTRADNVTYLCSPFFFLISIILYHRIVNLEAFWDIREMSKKLSIDQSHSYLFLRFVLNKRATNWNVRVLPSNKNINLRYTSNKEQIIIENIFYSSKTLLRNKQIYKPTLSHR